MEWTKETLLSTCIVVTSKKQGEKALKFYESFGFKTLSINLEIGRFIRVAAYDDSIVSVYPRQHRKTIIKLPVKPRRKFPREMMVSNDKKEWHRHIVFAKAKSEFPYISKANNFDGDEIFPMYWGSKYAKEIEPKETPDFDWDKYEKATLENQI
jgi:hypothetical protein